ncbi:hypothetical protein GKZ90_0018090 [Flavobacterium sp. MC2016-06]|uniref:hypothetical protein n=1 Tax=Flavobacterium sp. MC2016-06 TaxID=2676308 RepID=UPI0012BB0603|nr:hypothetical protein [Flavobacterium sp. MC2016-06]MBU3858377.1 hypothetical protein [Flavobacterium sp. MC2016-06]
MKKILKAIILTFILVQSAFAQKYNIELVSKNLELNFITTPKRGIEYCKIIYYVEKDLETISAYKNNTIIWQTNVVSVCGKPKVGKPKIRYIRLNKDKLHVVIGKHNYAEIDIINGKTEFTGAD